MSEQNEKSVPEQTDDEQNSQDQPRQGGEGKGQLLEYYLYPYDGGAGFQLIKQHPAITRFLEQQPGRTFMASNGMRISLSPFFPQWKESENIIFLDGTNGAKLKHMDHTYFQTVFDNYNRVRDRKIRAFKAALEELVDVVKATYQEVLRFNPMQRDKRNIRVSLA
jgi:hypothetical protein